MIEFPRIRYLIDAVPEAVFRAERAWSRATSGGTMLPDPDPPETPEKVYLRPLTSPRQDKLELATISVLDARDKARLMAMELSELQGQLALALQEKKIEGDARTVIIRRYIDGCGISRIAAELLGGKSERERNRIKYLLKSTEARLNS